MPKPFLGIRVGSLVGVLLLGAVCGSTLAAYLALIRDLPQIRELENYSPSAVTRIYSSDQDLLAELYVEKRDPVPMASIPKDLIAALLATEDRNFYSHHGVDIKGILRAVAKDIRAGGFVEGASTLTQQLSKTLFLTPRKTIVRKLKEALLAIQLERRYTKDELLTFYLNQIYLGSGAYGVQAAAKIYFGKPVQELDLAQCALIAGLPKAPSRYSPLVNPDLAKKRRNVVLDQMLQTGTIDAEAHRRAVGQAVIPKAAGKPSGVAPAPYFMSFIKGRLEALVGASLLYKGGLTIRTTLSREPQQEAQSALTANLATLEQRMRKQGINTPPQAALVALDVHSGAILAMVGGRSYETSAFNRATDALRQPGSAFKPIVYAYAVEQGFAQNQLLLDAPVVFKGGREGEDWQPENFSHTYQGEIPMRKALAQSENIPTVRLMERLGPSSVIQFAHALGINSPLANNLSLALGTSELNLLELTTVYATFANQGQCITPFGILEIIDNHGRTLWRVKPQHHVAMSRTGAAVITDMLQAVIQEGTGQPARRLPGPLAGKTGTTNQCRDALFVGYSPKIAAGVWVGTDDHTILGEKETGARAALPIWIDFMGAVLADAPQGYFDLPADVVKVNINPDTGQLVGPGEGHAVSALFKRGSEPLASP
jgi:penicillin-binding protein 1A